jgi:hypothetical protein
MQTLEPLAELTGLTVMEAPRIEEDSPLERSLAAIEDAPGNAVLCSHGDVIPDFVNGLIRRGMDIGEGPHALRKASAFVLHHANGLFTHAEYWDPPTI